MINQRANNILAHREYIGNFINAFMMENKYSLEARIKIDGSLSIVINYEDIDHRQTFRGIELTNEQRQNLAQFLAEHKVELWKDI